MFFVKKKKNAAVVVKHILNNFHVLVMFTEQDHDFNQKLVIMELAESLTQRTQVHH